MKHIILDLDNTIYDENLYLYSVFLEFGSIHHIDKILLQDICNKTLCDATRVNSTDIFKTFLNYTSMGYSAQLHDEIFQIYSSIECKIDLYNDAIELINFAQSKKIPLAILTNGPIQAQKNKIKNLKLQNIPIFYARSLGKTYEKPHYLAFKEVLNFFNTSPQHCIMIGDNPQTDILGAMSLGIKSFWIQRGYGKNITTHLKPQKINSLAEIIGFLDNNIIKTFI